MTSRTDLAVTAETEDRVEVLFEEARLRRRRRRRWMGMVGLVVALVVWGSLVAGGGGSRKPPLTTSHHPNGGKGSGTIKNAKESPSVPITRGPVVVEAGVIGSTSGWAMGGPEGLSITTDRGRTWRAVALPSYFDGRSVEELVNSVAASGPSDLWMSVGDVIGAVPLEQSTDGSVRESGIMRSTDGGATWTFAALPGCLQGCGGAPSMSFVDAEHGFAATGPDQFGRTTLFSTSDGGASWQELSLLPGEISGAQIIFSGLSDGWAVTGAVDSSSDAASPLLEGNTLLRTTDGGLTWQPVAGLPAHGLYELPTFFGNDDGVVVSYGASPTAFTTSDGGATWTARRLPFRSTGPALPPSQYQPVPFSAPSSTTWFALTPSALVETTDAGAHWQTVTSQIAWQTAIGPSQSLQFFSTTDGWVLNPERGCTGAHSSSCGTELVATDDGGRTWTATDP